MTDSTKHLDDIMLPIAEITRLRQEVEDQKCKVGQAYQVLGTLLLQGENPEIGDIQLSHDEIKRALDYFSEETYDDDFLLWPREGK